jgi:hypothetical protein
MSLPTSIADAPSSEARPWRGEVWRLAEAQHINATRKLVDTFEEQAALEAELEASKPAYPGDCAGLHFLLFTPFRYRTTPTRGSRFRAPGFTPGVYYGSQEVETAVAEICHHRMRTFQESPSVRPPTNPSPFTAFRVTASAERCIDLTALPFADHAAIWTEPEDYSGCQALAEKARAAGVTIILSQSVRDPYRRRNVNLLTCAAFVSREPEAQQTWEVFASMDNAWAIREFPRLNLEFDWASTSGQTRPA